MVLCTTALFFSGYVIQQRTLKDLRKAIRPDPRPSPQIYLPDRFKQSTTELEDGTVINTDRQDAPSDNPKQQKSVFVIEVRPTIPEEVAQKPLMVDASKEKPDTREGTKEMVDSVPRSKKKGSKKQNHKGEVEEEGPPSRAERRRRIKAEIKELSQGESPMYYQRRLW